MFCFIHILINEKYNMFVRWFALFVWFVALRPKSTVMVMMGWSVHLTTIFPEQA